MTCDTSTILCISTKSSVIDYAIVKPCMHQQPTHTRTSSCHCHHHSTKSFVSNDQASSTCTATMNRAIKRVYSDVEEGSTTPHVSRQRTQEIKGSKSMRTIVSQELQSTNVAVQEEGMKLLRTELWIQCKRKLADRQQEFLDMNAPHHVVRVMLQHPDNKNIQESGLRILMSATHCNDKARLIVSKENGMQAMVMAMKTHTTSQAIHFFSIKAIKNLCYLESLSLLFVHRLGAVPFLVNTMKRFAKEPSVVEVSCDLILLCCRTKKLRTLLLAANVASALAAAAECYIGQDVETAALDALQSLTST